MLTLRDLTFQVAFNKAMRASQASRASKPGQVLQPEKQSKPMLRDLSKPTTLFKRKFRSILGYLTLVGHLNKVWLVILQGTLVGHIESAI